MAQDNDKILIFDVETTGISPERDQIIELSIQHSLNNDSNAQTWRFKPSAPIQPEAQAVHGISMDDLKDCPPFSQHAEELEQIFSNAEYLVGYNVKFDLSFLLSEFDRAKLSPPNFSETIIIDPFQLWRHFEPRTLAGAHKKFVGSEFDGAHGAQADVAATGRVLLGMLKKFDLESSEWNEISKCCPIDSEQKSWIGPSNHFLWQNEEAVFGFGKHRGKPILTVAQDNNGSYVDWMSKKDFPKHVVEIATHARNKADQDFYSWLKKSYPR